MENLSTVNPRLVPIDNPPANCCREYDADCWQMSPGHIKRCILDHPFTGFCPMVASLPPASWKVRRTA